MDYTNKQPAGQSQPLDVVAEQDVGGGDTVSQAVSKIRDDAKQIVAEPIKTLKDNVKKEAAKAKKESPVTAKAVKGVVKRLKGEGKEQTGKRSFGQKFGDAVKWLGKNVLGTLARSVVPAAVTALTALCDEFFEKDERISAMRVLATMLATGARTEGNHSLATSLEAIIAECQLSKPDVSWEAAGNRGYSYDFDYAKSWIANVWVLNQNAAPPEWQLLNRGQNSWNWAVKSQTEGDSQNVGLPYYTLSALVAPFMSLFQGGDPGPLVKNLDTTIDSLAIGQYLKGLLAGGALAQNVRMSNADILTKMVAYLVGDSPQAEFMEDTFLVNSETRLNDAVDTQWGWNLTDDGINIGVYSNYWPLSANNNAQPAVSAALVDMDQFYQLALGTYRPLDLAQYGTVRTQFLPESWDKETAVVFITENMLGGNQALQLVTLSHMQFPAGLRGAPGRQFAMTNPAVPAAGALSEDDQCLVSNIYRHKIAGPIASVLFVMVDKFQKGNQGYKLTLPVVGAASIDVEQETTLYTGGAVPANTPDISNFMFQEFNPTVLWKSAFTWYTQLFSNPQDIRTARTAVAEMSTVKCLNQKIRLDLAGNLTLSQAEYLRVRGNAPQVNPIPWFLGLPDVDPVTLDGQYSLTAASYPSPMGVLPLARDDVLANIGMTHMIPGSTAIMRGLVAADIYEFVKDVTDQTSVQLYMPMSPVKWTAEINQLGDVMACIMDLCQERRGFPLYTLLYDTQDTNQYTTAIAVRKMANHLVQHMTYSNVGITDPGNLSPQALAYRNALCTARELSDMSVVRSDPYLVIARYANALLPCDSPYLDWDMNGDWQYAQRRNTGGQNQLVAWHPMSPMSSQYGSDFVRGLIPILSQTDYLQTQSGNNPWIDISFPMFVNVGDASGGDWYPTTVTARSWNLSFSVFNYLRSQTTVVSPLGTPQQRFTPGFWFPAMITRLANQGGTRHSSIVLTMDKQSYARSRQLVNNATLMSKHGSPSSTTIKAVDQVDIWQLTGLLEEHKKGEVPPEGGDPLN
jgi:hypothetical protein